MFRDGATVVIASSVLPTDPNELERLRHENARLRRTLGLRGRLEELVIDNARLRRALNTYGNHTHPLCHSLTSMDGFTTPTRQGCLCGLDEALKEHLGA